LFTLVSYDEFKKASEADLVPMRISEGTIGELSQKECSFFEIDLPLAFMFESSMMFTITDYAMNRSGKLHGWFDVFFSIDNYCC
jgi:homogentisate 1,2-dioxygenase